MQTFDFTGYRKHPRLNLWAREGCACFINAQGQPLAHNYPPAMRAKSVGRGYRGPIMRSHDKKACHVIMGEIFYGERPTFIDRHGKSYHGICHHLIEEPLNYCPENLLCWLTYSEHSIADRRRRMLESIVPDGNLHILPYEYLRYLQDPRTLSDEEFNQQLSYLRERKYNNI